MDFGLVGNKPKKNKEQMVDTEITEAKATNDMTNPIENYK